MSFDLGRRGDVGPAAMRSAVLQSLGAASVCWGGSPTGVFLEDRATEIADALLTEVEIYASRPCDDPHLGLARTAVLLTEIETRLRVSGEQFLAQRIDDLRRLMTPEQLAYRTVDS